MNKTPETSKITIYEIEDGKARIEVRFEHENDGRQSQGWSLGTRYLIRNLGNIRMP